MSKSSSDSVLVSTYKTFQIFDGIDAGDFCASAKKAHHQIWIFVDVSKCMIGKEYKRCNFIWGVIIWDDFGAKIENFQVGLRDWPGQRPTEFVMKSHEKYSCRRYDHL